MGEIQGDQIKRSVSGGSEGGHQEEVRTVPGRRRRILKRALGLADGEPSGEVGQVESGEIELPVQSGDCMKMLEKVAKWCEEGNGKAPGGDSRYLAALVGVKKAILWISEIQK